MMFIITGVIWSISTTTLQGRIKLQLNTMLFSKTLQKKDIAALGEDTGKVEEKEGVTKEKNEKKDSEDEAVSSKTQIMV